MICASNYELCQERFNIPDAIEIPTDFKDWDGTNHWDSFVDHIAGIVFDISTLTLVVILTRSEKVGIDLTQVNMVLQN